REHSSVPFAHMLDSSLIFVNPTPDPVRIRADYLDSSCPLHLLLGESGLFVQIPFVYPFTAANPSLIDRAGLFAWLVCVSLPVLIAPLLQLSQRPVLQRLVHVGLLPIINCSSPPLFSS